MPPPTVVDRAAALQELDKPEVNHVEVAHKVLQGYTEGTDWQWTMPASIQVPANLDVDSRCDTALEAPTVQELLSKGNSSHLEMVHNHIEALSDVDPIFERRIQLLQKESQSILEQYKATPMDTTTRDMGYSKEVVEAIAKLSHEAEESRWSRKEVVAAMAYRKRTIDANLIQIDEMLQGDSLPLDEEFLREFADDGMKNGWKGSFWKYYGRQHLDDDLGVKAAVWTQAEEMDELAGDTISLLVDQIDGCIREVQRLDGVVSIDTFDGLEHRKQDEVYEIGLWRQRLLAMKRKADSDLKRIQKEAKDVLSLDEEAAIESHKTHLKWERFCEESAQNVVVLNETLDGLQDWYNTERALRDNKSNPHELRLLAELNECAQALAAKKAELRESTRKWDLEREKKKAAATSEYQDLEDAYWTLREELESCLALVEQEKVKGQEMMLELEKEDVERPKLVAELLGSLKGRQTELEALIEGYAGGEKFAHWNSDMVLFLVSDGRDLQRDLRLHGKRFLGQTYVMGLEAFAKLSQLLTKLGANKKDRIEAIDSSIFSETQMLEFCVDTQDPNAHKHRSILDKLLGLRNNIEADLTSELDLHQTITEKAAPWYKELQVITINPEDSEDHDTLMDVHGPYLEDSLQRLAISPPEHSPVPPPPTSQYLADPQPLVPEPADEIEVAHKGPRLSVLDDRALDLVDLASDTAHTQQHSGGYSNHAQLLGMDQPMILRSTAKDLNFSREMLQTSMGTVYDARKFRVTRHTLQN